MAEGDVGGLNSLDVSESSTIVIPVISSIGVFLLIMAALLYFFVFKGQNHYEDETIYDSYIERKLYPLPIYCRIVTNNSSVSELIKNAMFGYIDLGDRFINYNRPIKFEDVNDIDENAITQENTIVCGNNTARKLTADSKDVKTTVAAIKKLVTDVKDSKGDYQTISLAAKKFRSSIGLKEDKFLQYNDLSELNVMFVETHNQEKLNKLLL